MAPAFMPKPKTIADPEQRIVAWRAPNDRTKPGKGDGTSKGKSLKGAAGTGKGSTDNSKGKSKLGKGKGGGISEKAEAKGGKGKMSVIPKGKGEKAPKAKAKVADKFDPKAKSKSSAKRKASSNDHQLAEVSPEWTAAGGGKGASKTSKRANKGVVPAVTPAGDDYGKVCRGMN